MRESRKSPLILISLFVEIRAIRGQLFGFGFGIWEFNMLPTGAVTFLFTDIEGSTKPVHLNTLYPRLSQVLSQDNPSWRMADGG